MLGPGISPFATSESFNILRHFADGTMKSGVPNFGIGAVDVRDVAEAHIRAGFTPTANGSYIVSAHDTDFPEMAGILRQRFGDTFPFPKRRMPKWVVWLLGPVLDKSLTRKMVSRNIDHPFRADNSKSIRDLGMSYRPLDISLIDMFQQMIDHDLVSP